MAQAKTGDTVKVHYSGKLEDGTEFDTSHGRDPLEFKLGEGQIIPGFEQAVTGMDAGDTKTVKIPADEAYGPYHQEFVQVVEKTKFPAELEPEVGKQYESRPEQGESFVVTVTEVTDETITLDGNHPLAGKDLFFDIELHEIV